MFTAFEALLGARGREQGEGPNMRSPEDEVETEGSKGSVAHQDTSGAQPNKRKRQLCISECYPETWTVDDAAAENEAPLPIAKRAMTVASPLPDSTPLPQELPVGYRVSTRMGPGTVAHNRSDGFQEIELDWTLADKGKVYLYTNETLVQFYSTAKITFKNPAVKEVLHTLGLKLGRDTENVFQNMTYLSQYAKIFANCRSYDSSSSGRVTEGIFRQTIGKWVSWHELDMLCYEYQEGYRADLAPTHSMRVSGFSFNERLPRHDAREIDYSKFMSEIVSPIQFTEIPGLIDGRDGSKYDEYFKSRDNQVLCDCGCRRLMWRNFPYVHVWAGTGQALGCSKKNGSIQDRRLAALEAAEKRRASAEKHVDPVHIKKNRLLGKIYQTYSDLGESGRIPIGLSINCSIKQLNLFLEAAKKRKKRN